MKKNSKTQKKRAEGSEVPRCGLCGKTENLTRTECCGQWICDDEDQYVPFSYERNSCHRNHSRYTLCSHHFNESHQGDWKTCKTCRDDFEDDLEMYVEYGTNEYNFEVLENPPAFEPTHCIRCGKVIIKANGGYTQNSEGCVCFDCEESPLEMFKPKKIELPDIDIEFQKPRPRYQIVETSEAKDDPESELLHEARKDDLRKRRKKVKKNR
jgi:hypothetical protein